MYLVLSVLMGLVQRYLNPPLWLLTAVFVPATFGVSYLGTHISELLLFDHMHWGLLILLYCCIASVVPVWALLQPRGYLGGFVLYSALFIGIVGIFFGGFEIKQPLFKTWDTGTMTGAMFPFLFVTIACGACSGFHGLVCSGTTSKQVERESHMKPVGYGAMLAEGFVALIALVTIMIASPDATKGLAPGTIYGNGIGDFLTLIIGKEHMAFAVTFGAMAFSTFVFDTLDVSTRLGRYIVQELFGWQSKFGGLLGTLLTIALPVIFVVSAGKGAWSKFWVLFGASNQLLAALTLLSITVWLHKARKRIAFTLLPMIFVLFFTLWALGKLTISNLQQSRGIDVNLINSVAALSLIILAIYLAISAVAKLKSARKLEVKTV
jgi:carbon starvation protein